MAQVEKSVEINAPIDDCIKLWLDVKSYPLFIKNLENVKKRPDKTETSWIWTTWTPLGKDEDWDVEIDNLDTSWYALNVAWGAYRCNFVMGTVGKEQTLLHVILEYVPAPQAVRACGHRIGHFPQHILDVDMHCFKELVEHPIRSKITPPNKSIPKHSSLVTGITPHCGM